MDAEGFKSFIEDRRWQFAKTMAHIPHEYTVADWDPDRVTFNEAVDFILTHGYKQKFFKRTYVYYDVGPHQYWPMNGDDGTPILINRALRK